MVFIRTIVRHFGHCNSAVLIGGRHRSTAPRRLRRRRGRIDLNADHLRPVTVLLVLLLGRLAFGGLLPTAVEQRGATLR